MADVGNSLTKAFDYVHGRFLGRLAGLSDGEYFWEPGAGLLVGEPRWWRAIGPAFGPYAQEATADLALHVLDEFVHHAAEVSLLRDLYLRKEQLGG